jgi:hypothetical protein
MLFGRDPVGATLQFEAQHGVVQQTGSVDALRL